MKHILKLILISAIIFNCQCQIFANENDTALEKALAPAGWVIGGTIAPAYIGLEYTNKSAEWTMEHVIYPTTESVLWLLGQAQDGLIEGANHTIMPVVYGIGDAFQLINSTSYKYILKPATRYIIKPVIIPVITTYNKTVDGVDYLIAVPLEKGVLWTTDKIIYVTVPIYDTAKTGVVYVSTPIARGVSYGTGAIANGINQTIGWSADNIVYPVGYQIGKGTDLIVAPVDKSIKATSKATKKTIKKIIGK